VSGHIVPNAATCCAALRMSTAAAGGP
jgi:hypothetical protein